MSLSLASAARKDLVFHARCDSALGAVQSARSRAISNNRRRQLRAGALSRSRAHSDVGSADVFCAFTVGNSLRIPVAWPRANGRGGNSHVSLSGSSSIFTIYPKKLPEEEGGCSGTAREEIRFGANAATLRMIMTSPKRYIPIVKPIPHA